MSDIPKKKPFKYYIIICKGCKDCKNNKILNQGIISNKIFGKQHIIKIIES